MVFARFVKICLTVMFAFSLNASTVAAPSDELTLVLNKKMPEMTLDKGSIQSWMQRYISLAHESGVAEKFHIGIEYDYSQSTTYEGFSLQSATVAQQLDSMTGKAGYVWQANGDWINVIPKTKADDTTYVLNQRMEGDITLSKLSSVATPVKDWFTQHGIFFVRDINMLKIAGYKKTDSLDHPVVLHNPTLREYTNAHEQLYENNIWTVSLKRLPLASGETAQKTMCTQWSQNTMGLADSLKKIDQPESKQ